MSPNDELTMADVAELVGVREQTIRVYRVREVIPEPDGFNGRSPWWRRSTIDQWIAERPSRGRPAKAEK